MFDLGKYAAEVAYAYAATGLLLAALLGVSLHRARRVHRALTAMETRTQTKGRTDG
ncbi:MAG: heme exporter protein CcmD [Celeribacter sp.]|jgi:heme exporter protein D